MNDVLAIQVAQLRNRADALGQAVADLVRDAYAMGRADGLAERVRSCGDAGGPAGISPCVKPSGHDGRHGYAGTFWPVKPVEVSRDPDYSERDDPATRRPWRI